MSRTLDDLRGALRDEADLAPYPDVDALVAGARRRVAISRRRRLAAIGTATAIVLAVGALTTLTGPADKAAPQPARSGLGQFSVDATGGGFPEYSEGMQRLMVLDAPMLGQLNGSITVPAALGRRLAVRMTCTAPGVVNGNGMDTLNEWNTRMTANFTMWGSRGGSAKCDLGLANQGFALIGTTRAARSTVMADVFTSRMRLPAPGSLFKDAKLHVAFYQSVPRAEYRFPPRPANLESSYAWQNVPGRVRVVGPQTSAAANKPLTFTQPFDAALTLTLQFRGPGRIKVLINGRDIGPELFRSGLDGVSRPLQEDGAISMWDYTSSDFTFPLDPGFRAPNELTPRKGTPLRVTIIPTGFNGPDWRAEVLRQPPNG